MATVLFSGITDGSTITFDPDSDVLQFDDNALTAASVVISNDNDLTHISIAADGKTFSLPNTISLTELTFENVTFDDGSLLLVGADSDEFQSGDSGDDQLLGLDGDDELSGGDGDDVLDGGSGADRMFGGLGDDTFIVDSSDDVATDIPALTHRVSTSSAGAEANGESLKPGISGDGRYVVFSSSATNLVGGDSNGVSDIFVKDTRTGEVLCLSRTAADGQANAASLNAQIAAEGPYVVFESSATNLVGGDTNGVTDIFVKDMLTGAIGRASTSAAGVEANGSSTISEITADGHYVVFESGATNLVAGDSNSRNDIFVKDLLTGAIVRASTSSAGVQTNGNAYSASATADGRYIAFTSTGTNLVGSDTNGVADIFVKDLQTGAIESVSVSSSEVQGNGESSWAKVAGDGRYVVFQSNATNLVSGDTNGVTDIFVRDLQSGTTTRVNTSSSSAQANAISYDADISADGRYVVFMSSATNLADGIPSGSLRAYVKDLQTGEIAHVSASSLGILAGGASTHVQISADGRTLTFKSAGKSLVNDDDNNVADIFTVENPLRHGGTDTVRSSISWTLDSSIENLVLTGAAHINGTGNGANNVINGNAGNNVLSGGAGTDTLNGGDGDDTYVITNADIVSEDANEGTDTVESSVNYTLVANVENLVLTGSASINGNGNSLDNVMTGNGGNNTLNGGGGNDTLNGVSGTDTLSGGDGDDLYITNSTSDILTEDDGEGTDTVKASVSYTLGANFERLTLFGTGDINGTGNSADNIITGNAGDNVLDGGGGNDTLIGGDGDDTYVLKNGDTFTELVGEGSDTIMIGTSYTLGSDNVENVTLTGAGNINLTGNAEGNVLTGNSGQNTLTGNGGNDTLSGGAGQDTLIGGLGNDTYILSDADIITENDGEGNDTVKVSVSYTLGGGSVENLALSGSANINATGNSGDNSITGNSGKNILSGGSGNDTLSGGAGLDSLKGGSGNDTYILSDKDTITENSGQGTDTVKASISYTLDSNVENLTLSGSGNINGTGNSAKNVITGNSGNNTLSGGGGIDTLRGGLGNDIYTLTDNDTISESSGQGSDTVKASFSYTLGSNLENLTLTGSSSLTGKGNSLNNKIVGNSGSNVLNGSTGNDFITSGGGNDTIVFNTALSNSSNVDTLVDFSSAADVIHLDSDIFTTLSPGGFLGNHQFAFNSTGVAKDSNDRIILNTATGALYYDRDGTGAAAKVHFADVFDDISPFDFFII